MRYLLALLACVAVPLSVAHAQWRIGADIGALDFGAIARDTLTDARWATPGSAVTAGVRVERGMGRGRVRLAFGVSTAGVGLAIESDSVSVGIKGAFRFVELMPEIAFRLTRTAAGAEFWLEAGPVLSVWLPDGSEGRVRGGGFGGVAVAVPLLARLTGAFGVRATFIASPLADPELPEDLVRCAAGRVTAQAGVRYRL